MSDQQEQYVFKNNVQEIINYIGFGKFQILMFMFTGFCWMADAVETQVVSLVSKLAHCDFLKEPDKATQYLPAATYAGQAIGAYIFGYISDKFGRKTGLFTVCLFTAIFGFLSVASHNYWALILLRFFVGIGLGGVHVGITLLQEVIPPVNRHLFVSLELLQFTIGGVIQGVIAYAMIPRLGPHGWRYFTLVATGPILLACLLYPFLLESPKWLVVHGKFQKAQQNLIYMAKLNGKTIPHDLLQSVIPQNLIRQNIEDDQSERKALMSRSKARAIKEKTIGFIEGFQEFGRYLGRNGRILLTVVILLFCWFFVGIAYFGSIQIPTTIRANGRIPFQCNEQTHEVIATKADYVNNIAQTVGDAAGNFFCTGLMFFIPRKYVFSIAVIISGLALIVQAIIIRPEYINQPWEGKTLTALQYLSRATSSGSVVVMYVITTEVIITNFRSQILGMNSFMYRFGAFISPLIVVGMNYNHHAIGALALQAAVITTAGIMMLFLPFEQKGKQMVEDDIIIKKRHHNLASHESRELMETEIQNGKPS